MKELHHHFKCGIIPLERIKYSFFDGNATHAAQLGQCPLFNIKQAQIDDWRTLQFICESRYCADCRESKAKFMTLFISSATTDSA